MNIFLNKFVKVGFVKVHDLLRLVVFEFVKVANTIGVYPVFFAPQLLLQRLKITINIGV